METEPQTGCKTPESGLDMWNKKQNQCNIFYEYVRTLCKLSSSSELIRLGVMIKKKNRFSRSRT